MLTADGCTFTKLRYTPFKRGTEKPDHARAQEFDRIKNGEGTRGSHGPERCHDCGAKDGHFHHPGCDWEECPRCHGQLIGCDCNESGMFADTLTLAATGTLTHAAVECIGPGCSICGHFDKSAK